MRKLFSIFAVAVAAIFAVSCEKPNSNEPEKPIDIPSEVVTPEEFNIDIEIKDGIIQKVVYTRGCEGNAKGIGALIKDMSVEEAIRRLEGINCGKRGTSCPDQLAKILKALE